MINPYALGLNVSSISGNEARCFCFAHQNIHTPSASFNMISGAYYCFSCGAKYKNEYEVSAALIELEYNSTIEEFTIDKQDNQVYIDDYVYYLNLPYAYDNEYLKSRRVTNEQVKKYSIRSSGDCVIFPLKNKSGMVIGVQKRYVSNHAPKYILSGEYPLVYPFNNIYGRFTVVEGIFGVLNFENQCQKAVCLFGTGNVNKLREIKHLNGRIAFDDDLAGMKATLIAHQATGWLFALPGIEADENDDLNSVNYTNDINLLKKYLKEKYNEEAV